MFERFTERARKVMSLSRQEAQRYDSDGIGPEHILLGLVAEGGGVAVKALRHFGVDLTRVRLEMDRIIVRPSGPSMLLGSIPFTPRAKRIIELAGEEASRVHSDVIGTGHLLVGCLAEKDGLAAQVLANFDVMLPRLQAVIGDLEAEAGSGPLPVTGKIRIVFYKKDPMTTSKKVLFIGDVAHVEVSSLVIEGMKPDDRRSVSAALAAQRGCDAYSVEDLPQGA